MTTCSFQISLTVHEEVCLHSLHFLAEHFLKQCSECFYLVFFSLDFCTFWQTGMISLLRMVVSWMEKYLALGRVYARLPILTFFSKLLQVPDFWLKGHVNSGLRPFLGLFIKNWVSAPGYSAGTWFWSSACAGKFGKIDISRTTGPIKLADPSF